MSSEAFQKRRELIIRIFNKIEKTIFFISLPVIILFVLPISWNQYEYGKGIAIFIFASTLLTLELIKFLLTGRFAILKSSLDIVLLLSMFVLLVSSIFSQDFLLTLIGYNYSFGSGSIFAISGILYFLVFRSIFSGEEDLKSLIQLIIYTVTVGSIVSILSFFNWFPSNEFFQMFVAGTPIFDKAPQLLILWPVTILLVLGFLQNISFRKNIRDLVLMLTSMVVLLMAFYMYSTIYSTIFTLVFFILLIIYAIITNSLKGFVDKTNFSIIISLIVITGIMTISQFIPTVKNSVVSLNSAEQGVLLDYDSSWSIATKVITENLKSGLIGVGYDLDSNAVFKYLPNNVVNSDKTDKFIFSSEAFKVIIGTGVIGLLIFIYSFWQVIKSLYTDLLKIKNRIAGIQYIELVAIYSLFVIFVFSFITSFTNQIYFVISGLLTIYVIAKSLANQRDAEQFVIEIEFLEESISMKKAQIAPIITIVILVLLQIIVYYFVFSSLTSTIYVLQAESKIVNIQKRLEDNSITDDQRKTELDRIIKLYIDAANSHRWNYVIYRRLSIINMEYLKLLNEDYNESASQLEKDGILKDIARYAGNAADNALRSTDLSPTIAKNWLNRISIYNDLISIGFTSYVAQGLESIEGAKKVVPSNNIVYYYEAQFLLLEAKPKDAAVALNQSILLNPNHIPSLILAGDLDYANKNWANSKLFYERAINLLNESGQADSDLYKTIKARLLEIEGKLSNS